MATKMKNGPPSAGGDHENIDVNAQGKKAFQEMADGLSVQLHGSGGGSPQGGANKAHSANAGGSSTRQAKGGGAPYATGDNFAPAQPNIGPDNAGGNNTTPANASPGSTPLTQPSASGGQLASTDNVLGDLKRMENENNAKDASQIPNKDLRENENETNPGSRKSQKYGAKQTQEEASIPAADLRAAEKGSFYNKGAKPTKLKDKALDYIKKRKLKFIVGGIGVGGAFFILMLILFLLGTLLIPHFISNVVGWQFVKVTRAAYVSNQAVLEEQAATAGASDEALAAMNAKYANDATFQDLKSLNPDEMNKVPKNMNNNTFEELTTKDPATGRVRLTGIKYKDSQTNTFVTEKVNEAKTFNGIIQDSAAFNDAAAAQNVTKAGTAMLDELNPSVAASPVYAGPKVQDDILAKQLNTTDAGMDPSTVNDKESEAQARAAVEEQTFAAVEDTGGVSGSNIDSQNTEAQKAETLLEADMKDPAQVSTIVSESGNLPSNVVQLINNDFVQSALDSVASKVGEFLNPLSGKLIPFCIVDEGSKVNGPTAQAQSSEVQRSAVLTMAVADQQKRGSPYVNASMVGAWNWKLNGDQRDGGVNDSIAIQRASGAKVSTAGQISTEGSPLGNLANNGNILAALGVPFSGPLQSALDTICPAVTNIWVNLGLGAINLTFLILSAIFTGGSGDAVEAGADATTEEVATVVTDSIIGRIVASFSTKTASSGFNILKDFGKNVIIQGGLTAGATFLAKFIVLSQMGAVHNGLSTGIQYDNDVDNGTNQLTNEVVGHAYGGRPLTNTEAMQVQQDDNKTLAEFNKSRSTYQRYLALSNPQSLASILTDRVATNLNYGFFSSMLADIGNIFNPAKLMPQVLFGSASGQANAASNIDTVDYGNVQQGYSDAEYALIASSNSYKSPSENQYVLDASNQEAQVQSTYAPCFDDSVATLLTTNDGNGVPYLVRDAQGNVSQTNGLCSPQNLGPNNPTYGDLVFRYRLTLNYNTTISTLQNIANAT